MLLNTQRERCFSQEWLFQGCIYCFSLDVFKEQQTWLNKPLLKIKKCPHFTAHGPTPNTPLNCETPCVCSAFTGSTLRLSFWATPPSAHPK